MGSPAVANGGGSEDKDHEKVGITPVPPAEYKRKPNVLFTEGFL